MIRADADELTLQVKRQINLGLSQTGLKVCDMFFRSNLNVKDALNRLRRNAEAPTI